SIDANQRSHVYKLKKALYGLKQAPMAWYDELSKFLLQNHFIKGTIDPTLFTRRYDNDIVVQIYVDDIIFGSTNLSKAKKDAPKEPPKDWTVAEETALCQAWCDVSENNIAGNNMKTSGFWDAVITYFERETGSTSGYDSIVSKCVTPSSNVHWIAQRN
ncbi:copia protein, partial [Tanacetum coccineum]